MPKHKPLLHELIFQETTNPNDHFNCHGAKLALLNSHCISMLVEEYKSCSYSRFDFSNYAFNSLSPNDIYTIFEAISSNTVELILDDTDLSSLNFEQIIELAKALKQATKIRNISLKDCGLERMSEASFKILAQCIMSLPYLNFENIKLEGNNLNSKQQKLIRDLQLQSSDCKREQITPLFSAEPTARTERCRSTSPSRR